MSETIDRERLALHYQIIREVLWSPRFVGYKVDAIRRKVDLLTEYLHDVRLVDCKTIEKINLRKGTKEFIINDLWIKYTTTREYEKFNPDVCSLSTFIVQFVHWEMKNLLRRYRPRTDDEINTLDIRTDYLDERNIGLRSKLHDNLQDKYDLEQQMIVKDLIQKMIEFGFDLNDVECLMGLVDRKVVADEKSMSYEGYKKQLQRKIKKFRTHHKLF